MWGQDVSYTDCLVMAMAEQHGTIDIFGFDETFFKRGFLLANSTRSGRLNINVVRRKLNDVINGEIHQTLCLVGVNLPEVNVKSGDWLPRRGSWSKSPSRISPNIRKYPEQKCPVVIPLEQAS
jgi:hypothetical protein